MKIKSLLLIGLMTIGSMNAFADNFKSGGLVYTLTKGTSPKPNTATVDGVRKGYLTATNKSIVIPKTVTDGDGVVYNVTGFTSNTWFSTASTTTDFETEDVTSITNKPTSLTINIDNFTAIPTAAQVAITSLTTLELKGTKAASISIPDYNKTLTALATLDLDGLSVTGKGNTFTLGAQTAATKPALATVTLPAGTDLPTNAFKGQTALTSITGAKNIGASAFAGCTALESITFTGDAIGANAFDGAKKLKAVDLADVKTIGTQAFNGCVALTELTFGKNLASIGANAFDGCTGVTAVSFGKCATLDPSKVSCTFPGNAYKSIKLGGSQIQLSVFANLSKARESLKRVTISAVESSTFDFSGFTALTTVTFAVDKDGKGIKTIPAGAFGKYSTGGKDYYCSALTTVELPASLTTIDDNAFEGSGLTAITIPAAVTTIGVAAFKNCASLADLTFNAPEEYSTSDPVMTIDANAFEGAAVSKVKLTPNVHYVNADAFKNCTSLKSFTASLYRFEAGNAWGFVGDVTNNELISYFEGCENLKSVTIPGTVTDIAANAFKGLAKLATVTFNYDPENDALQSIGDNAFEGCEALTAIDLSATNLTDLGNSEIFKDCKALATITLPETLTGDLGKGIFAGTSIAKLDASMVNGNVFNIFETSLVKGKEVANTTLKSLKLGNAYIWSGSFQNCTALKTAEIGAATIEDDAFAYCEKLATVTVNPYDVVTGDAADIWESAFDHCTGLTTFTYMPEDLDPANFGDVNGRAFTGCTPYVLFDTTKEFATDYTATFGGSPINTKWSDDVITTEIQTVQDKANPNQFVAKFWSPYYDAAFDANEVKLYSVYMDGETAYFQACRVQDGMYYVPFDTHVILKTTEEKKVKWAPNPMMGAPAVAFDDMVSLDHNGDLAEIQALFWFGAGLQPGEYVYRLTNTEEQGFGFTAFNGTKIKANQFFIASTKKPEGAAPLNIVWLDEDGNVEGDATAIQKIQNTDAENGAIYNLQGVRVQKAQKGLYIQNGKKYVVK